MRALKRIWSDLRVLSFAQAGRLVMLRVTRRWNHRRQNALAFRKIECIRNDLASVIAPGVDLTSLLETKFSTLEGFPISPTQRDQVGALIGAEFPAWRDRCIADAEAILRNQFRILGHAISLGERIHWHKDYLSGAEWSSGKPIPSPGGPSDHGPDIKFVWELSRFHQGVTLGRAFAITGDERYAEKFVALFTEWQRANGACDGPNWTCAMEVAIRAVNLLWAASLVSSSRAFRGEIRETFVSSLLCHGAYIFHHREYDERVVGNALLPINGNHYLSNLVGLLFISAAFPECRFSAEWQAFATREFFRELESQVDEEGVNWEYSPNYHRLVLELVLSTHILLERQGVSTPPPLRTKMKRMLDWMRHYRMPSGEIPAVRDVDNGRLCILGDDELTRHDHLMELGAKLFGEPQFLPAQPHEDCLWLLGPKASTRTADHPGLAERLPPSRLFQNSGFAVMRKDSLAVLAICCPKGMSGYCGHTHNDFLSFELEAYGRPFLIDPGSYVYSRSREWRNRMRGTACHNTLMLAGKEQNSFPAHELFEIDSLSKPTVREWKTQTEADILEGEYPIFLGEGKQAIHRRRFVFSDRILGCRTASAQTASTSGHATSDR